MLKFIPAEDNVFAVEVARKITGEDLDAILDQLEPMLEQHDKVHVFVETKSIDGIEIAGFTRYAARAMPLFGKLRQFGRVAVVADQGWVRAGTRLESAMLPFISYNTYLPEDREAALAWVRGGNQPTG